MASIKITDTLGTELVSANPPSSRGFGKYIQQARAFIARNDVVDQLRTPLPLINNGETGLRLSCKDSIPIGTGTEAWTIDAGAQATLSVFNRPGMRLGPDLFLGPALTVPAGRSFVSFAVHPTLALDARPQAGGLSFGFSPGSSSEWQCYLPFDVTGAQPSLGDAARQVLERFVIPNTTADLRGMTDLPAGTLVCVSGSGSVTISATVDVAAAFNPLASVSTLPKLGTLSIQPAATARIGVSATLTGGYQIRVQRLDGARIRFSIDTSAARGLDVSLAATGGAGVVLGERDLLAMLFRSPGGLPDATTEDLERAGITRAQLDRLEAVMKGALSRRLELSLSAQFSSLESGESAFDYEIDLGAIDAAAEAALDRALAGDLGPLNELEPQMPAHGLRLLRSGTQSMRERKIAWRINLVGLVNIVSLRDLVRTGTVTHDEESGELVITDKITSDHVGTVVEPRQLRKLLYESTMITLAYKAAGLDVNRSLAASQSFFFFDKHANRQRVSDFLDAVAALGLVSSASASTLLGGDDDFGKTSLMLETTFDQAAAERAFGLPGPPPDQAWFENIGRQALLALVTETDPDAYRRRPLTDTTLWQAMKDAGQPNFRSVLPPPITGGGDTRDALRVAVVAADYSLIVWWASAMALAAKRLGDMRTFLAGRQAVDLDQDQDFRTRRADLEEAIVKAIRRNTASFDDPWGLVALFMASGGTAKASATIVSPRFTVLVPE